MSPTSTEELTELLERATERPWHTNPKDAEESFFEDVNILKHSGLAVAVAVHNGDIQPETVAANAALIVAAVNALPCLLADNERLRGDVANLSHSITLREQLQTRCQETQAHTERLWRNAEARALTAEAKLSALGGGETRRTPTDYAIEHAGYLDDAASHFLSCVTEFVAEDDEEAQEAHDASCSDSAQALRCAIHEFRKRANRALPTPEEDTATINQPGDRA